MARSIIQTKRECYMCRRILGNDIELSPSGLEEHHIFNGPNRSLSEQHGLKVWLCHSHHRTGMGSVHKNACIMKHMKQVGQKAYESRYGRESFMEIFGRNYLAE